MLAQIDWNEAITTIGFVIVSVVFLYLIFR